MSLTYEIALIDSFYEHDLSCFGMSNCICNCEIFTEERIVIVITTGFERLIDRQYVENLVFYDGKLCGVVQTSSKSKMLTLAKGSI